MTLDQERELDEDGRRIMRHWNDGDLTTATTLAIAANAKAKTWLGEAHPRYAGGLAALARIYFEAGRLEHSEAELLEYADVEFRQCGPMSREYAEALSRLSTVCNAMPGRERDAGNLRNAASAIMSKLFLKLPDMALENTLGGLHRNLQLIRLRRHHNAGRQAEKEYDYAAAESYYRRALASIPPDLSDTALNGVDTQLTLAGLLSLLGRLGEAEAIGEEAHERLLRILGSDDLRVAKSLCDLALNRNRQGKAEAAMSAYQEVLRISNLSTDDALSAEHMDLREDALKGTAGVLMDFAHLMRDAGANVHQALAIYRELDPLVRRHGLNSREFGMHLANIARIHWSAGALGSAYSLLGTSTRIFQELGEEAQELYHTNLYNIGQLGLEAGYLAEAREHLERSLAWHKKLFGDHHEEVAKCLSTLAAVAACQGKRTDFLEFVQALQRTDDAVIADRLALLPEADALRVAAQIWGRTEQSLLGAVTLGLGEDEGLATVYLLLISRRGVVLASLIAGARNLRGCSPEPRPVKLGAGIELAALRRAVGKGAALVEYVRIGTEMFGPRIGPGDLMLPRCLELAELTESTPILHFDFARALDLDTVTDWRGRYLAAVVITGGESNGLKLLDLGPAKSIEDLVETYKQALMAERIELRDRDVLTTVQSNYEGRALRAVIFDPIARFLQEPTTLYVVPDGIIGSIPLEGLPTETGGNVIDEFEIAYLYNARDLLHLQMQAPRSPALVVGNPDYDAGFEAGSRSGRRRFEPLSGSEEEARSVAATLKVPPILGAAATKARIQATQGPAVLHLATHGIFFGENQAVGGAKAGMNWSAALSSPLRRSGVALAGANTDSDSGILLAEEVLMLDLFGTELVTLSACHSISGEMQLGEGVLGFARAFAVAGARNVVMSVWDTSDEVTRRFMETFYQKISEGALPPAALRAAKLEIRKFLPHPFYWNAFLYQGATSA